MLLEDLMLNGLEASLLAAGISTFGILAISYFSNWAKKNTPYFAAFAVGVISTSILFHLIPESISLSETAIGWIAIGFASMVLVGIAVQSIVHRQPDGAALNFGYASIIVLAVHSFLDGGVYAVSFHDEAFTGWLATAGLILHEFPEGVIAFSLLQSTKISTKRAIFLAILAAGVTTVAGMVVANMALLVLDTLPVAEMLGAAAGVLIYVSIVHLGPHAAGAANKRGYDIAALGVIISMGAILFELFGHAH